MAFDCFMFAPELVVCTMLKGVLQSESESPRSDSWLPNASLQTSPIHGSGSHNSRRELFETPQRPQNDTMTERLAAGANGSPNTKSHEKHATSIFKKFQFTRTKGTSAERMAAGTDGKSPNTKSNERHATSIFKKFQSTRTKGTSACLPEKKIAHLRKRYYSNLTIAAARRATGCARETIKSYFKLFESEDVKKKKNIIKKRPRARPHTVQQVELYENGP